MLKKSIQSVFAALILTTSILVITPGASENSAEKARQAWTPFFMKFMSALKKRDQQALRQMMAADIHFSDGGGDDNRDGDYRDDAFKFWDEFNSWTAIENALKKEAVPMTLWWSNGQPRQYPGRVAPPAANRKGSRSFHYYAVFEFRDDGKWYCVVLNQCCD